MTRAAELARVNGPGGQAKGELKNDGANESGSRFDDGVDDFYDDHNDDDHRGHNDHNHRNDVAG